MNRNELFVDCEREARWPARPAVPSPAILSSSSGVFECSNASEFAIEEDWYRAGVVFVMVGMVAP